MTDRKKVRLHFYSETGTEGGWYAAQDYDHITPAPIEASDKSCKRCGIVWADFRHSVRPHARPFTYRDKKGELTSGTTLPKNTRLGKDPSDIYYIKHNKDISECIENGHDWQDYGPFEKWSYEGLRMLNTGDILEILDDDENITQVVQCRFYSNGDQYAPGAKSAMGFAIHGYIDPNVMNEDEWNTMFLINKTDAYLTPVEKS